VNKAVDRGSWIVDRVSPGALPAQKSLALDDQSTAAALRLAFDRSDLARRPSWNFERAMKCPSVRCCIENTARAILRARSRKARRAAHAPVTSAE